MADARLNPGRKQFPILGGQGAKIDWQLVADHGEQAKKNHYQTIERLAERGGLSWCELYAVLHDRKWQKMDTNDAIIACRGLEARYLTVAATPPAEVVEAMERALRRAIDEAVADSLDPWFADAKAALANLEAWRAGK